MKRAPLALAALVAALSACVTGPHGPERERVSTSLAPAPIGPYSQAIRAGETLYLAGQVGLDPTSGALVEGGIEAETRRALDNLFAVLHAAGFEPADVVQAQVFLIDLADFGAMNSIYAERFAGAAPARATVQVAALPKGARIEISLVAVKRD